jgi:hypothetical protein
MPGRRFAVLGLLLVLLVALAVATWAWRRASRAADGLAQRVAAAQGPGAAQAVDCALLRKQSPLVLLALGQSNAGNHGQQPVAGLQPIVVFHAGRCWQAQDPLPGATGAGGSLWWPLVAQLQAAAPGRPIVLATLAVDASSSTEWTAEGSPLRARLAVVAAELLRAQLVPHWVLWQQGEADARLGVPAQRYRENLLQLQIQLHDGGIRAPMVLAKSTVCRSAPSQAIRQAVDRLVASEPGFEAGPDTDELVDTLLAGASTASQLRYDGCHFSALGLQRAAQLWGSVMQARIGLTGAAPGLR